MDRRVNGRALQWWPALFVALPAFAFRMQSLEMVRHNFDRGYPHGLGIAIREAILQGRLDQLPAVSLVASINFPNPAGASYFYALLTAIEPSAYVATALNAMLGAVVAVIAYDIARRLFGSWAGLVAGVLAGTSLWAGWVARGAWLQGPVEFMAAITFWLLVNGLAHRKPSHVFAAMAGVALFMQTYLVMFGLLPMAVVTAGAGLLRRHRTASLRPLIRPFVMGLALCILSALLYIGATVSARASVESVINNPNAYNEETRAGGINLDPINHAFRIASGRDFESTFVLRDTPNFALRDSASDLRATLIDLLMLIGLGAALAVAFSKHTPARNAITSRMLLVWLALPILGTLLIANFVMRDWKVHVFYILLTVPAPYVLAGAPFGLLQRRLAHASLTVQRAVATGLVVVLAGAFALNQLNFAGDIEAVARFPYNNDGLYSLPLKWQIEMAHAANAGCAAINNDEDPRWLASVFGNASRVRAGGYHTKVDSVIWSVVPEGGTCHVQAMGPALPQAGVTSIIVPGVKEMDRTPIELSLYHAAAMQPSVALTQPLPVNLGWTLMDLQTPAQASAGETITVSHAWRVDVLPQEPYASWYYAPFIKLIAPDGSTVINVDGATALEGWGWRAGEWMLSDVRMNLPPDLSAGDYTLEMSLFDPNQKKNAVYFDPVAPATPIVTIQRQLFIQ